MNTAAHRLNRSTFVLSIFFYFNLILKSGSVFCLSSLPYFLKHKHKNI